MSALRQTHYTHTTTTASPSPPPPTSATKTPKKDKIPPPLPGGGRLSIRHECRPIDVNLPMPVLIQEDSALGPDAITVKGSFATRYATYHEEIAIPTFHDRAEEAEADDHYAAPFERPAAYIRYNAERDVSNTEKTVKPYEEYDMESEDEAFLGRLQQSTGHNLQPTTFERLITCLEKALEQANSSRALLPPPTPPPTTPSRVRKKEAKDQDTSLVDVPAVAKACKMSIKVARRVFSYYLDKRQRLGKPLLLRFQKNPVFEENNPDPSPKKKFKFSSPLQPNSTGLRKQCYLKLMMLRQDFDRARMLVDLVRKRETLKRERLKVMQMVLLLYIDSTRVS